jgi:hypothetical protein
MDVPNPRRHIEGAQTEHWYDAQVLGPILDEYPTESELLR